MDHDLCVLVVDDHQIVAEGCQHRFESAGFHWSFQWKASLHNTDINDIDLVILDLRLADGSTPSDNIRILSAQKVPVIVYSSGDDPVLVREAIAAGVLAVVRKSSPSEELIQAALAALQGLPTVGLEWASALDADTDFVKECLSENEARVLSLYAMGEKSVKVARKLGLSKNTVDTYIARIRGKYRDAGRPAETRVDLFLRAAEDGLVSYFDH